MSRRYTDWRHVRTIIGAAHQVFVQTNSKGHWRAYRTPGPDGIHPQIFKRTLEARAEVLAWARQLCDPVQRETETEWPYTVQPLWPVPIPRSVRLSK